MITQETLFKLCRENEPPYIPEEVEPPKTTGRKVVDAAKRVGQGAIAAGAGLVETVNALGHTTGVQQANPRY